ncbi:MAG TPA: FtsH protease activity modulator HflK [Gammaproteobacteria bacterium]|nr:FtsH protease activity modulator HflK [Gammaproteobacteria bacterium]
MAWNEPGNKDPWGKRRGEQGPPDLDKIVKDLQRRLGGLFGGRRGNGGSAGGGAPSMGAPTVIVLLIVGLIAWALTGVYKLDAAERGVVLRFGAYQATTMPGLHWHLPIPIENVEKVNVSQAQDYQHQTRMLTADENIVALDMVVQYRNADPEAFVFNVRDPEATLQEVSQSAIREVVGQNNMDFIIGEGREGIARRTQELIQSTLDAYQTGITVIVVNLLDANFPAQVQDAVRDAIKAREDKVRLGLAAQAYANEVVPRARGAAASQTESAEAYRSRVIAEAVGEANRFLQLAAEYEQAPDVTRERLYLETVEEVLGRAQKIFIDAEGSGNLLYLPIDKLLERQAPPPARNGDAGTPAMPEFETERNDPRSRGSRE